MSTVLRIRARQWIGWSQYARGKRIPLVSGSIAWITKSGPNSTKVTDMTNGNSSIVRWTSKLYTHIKLNINEPPSFCCFFHKMLESWYHSCIEAWDLPIGLIVTLCSWYRFEADSFVWCDVESEPELGGVFQQHCERYFKAGHSLFPESVWISYGYLFCCWYTFRVHQVSIRYHDNVLVSTTGSKKED